MVNYCNTFYIKLLDYFVRFHPHAPVAYSSISDDGSPATHRHHSLREHPRICCRSPEHPQVSDCFITGDHKDLFIEGYRMINDTYYSLQVCLWGAR